MAPMLDNLPAALRHALISLASSVALALLTLAQDNVDALSMPPAARVILAALLPTLILWFTPLSRQYGVGSADDNADDNAA
jgi:hypothetical protein